jgi:hypothetical protein
MPWINGCLPVVPSRKANDSTTPTKPYTVTVINLRPKESRALLSGSDSVQDTTWAIPPP